MGEGSSATSADTGCGPRSPSGVLPWQRFTISGKFDERIAFHNNKVDDWIDGLNASPAAGNFAASTNSVQLTVGNDNNRTYTVQAGMDEDGDGTLDSGEVDHAVNVKMVSVDLDVIAPGATEVLGETDEDDPGSWISQIDPGSIVVRPIGVSGFTRTLEWNRFLIDLKDENGNILNSGILTLSEEDGEKTFAVTAKAGVDPDITSLVKLTATREALTGNDSVRLHQHEVTVRWVSKPASPLQTNTHLNGGKMILPDAISPTDTTQRDLVDVEATVWSRPSAGTTVFFRSFDVDDPAADADFELDPGDEGHSVGRGGDNRGTTPGNRGSFVGAGTNYGASAVTDANGKATVTFQVTMQPGDNFRVAAALSNATLDQLTTLADYDAPDANHIVSPNNEQLVDIPEVGLTEMLTVWRRLWIERDAMTPATAAPTAVNITGVTVNVVQPGRAFGVDVVQLDTELPDGEDAFEGGTLTIPSFGGKTVAVYKNMDPFGDDTLEVPANAFTAAELATIAAGAVPASLVDDDDLTVLGTAAAPRLIDGGTLLESAFGDAYILPLYADTFNTTVTIPFKRNLADLDVQTGYLNNARDLVSSATFWTTVVVSCFQPALDYDGDSDGDPVRLGISILTEGAEYGVTPENSNEVGIYLETIRDLTTAGIINTDEAHTVVHEIGHSGGVSGNPHPNEGIMGAGAPSSENHFSNESQATFRDLIIW